MNNRLNSIYAVAAALGLTASVSMSAADQGPNPVSRPAPSYAFDMRHDEIEGKVTVTFTVSAKGDVEDAAVVSSTEKAFEHAALAAVRQWKFTPATKDGVAVSASARQTINFALPYLHAKNATALASAGVKPDAPATSEVAVNR
jgi:protein TonB